jgi:hypothetical protein
LRNIYSLSFTIQSPLFLQLYQLRVKRVLLWGLFFIWGLIPASAQDTVPAAIPPPDTVKVNIDSLPITAVAQYNTALRELLAIHPYLNSNGKPFANTVVPRVLRSRDHLFYIVMGLLLYLALLRVFYTRYFFNLFRVFFNTSLRQSQLTDQLLQAKLPSLFFNLFFIVAAGLFAYLLLLRFHWISDTTRWWVALPIAVAAVGGIYGGKFLTLSFTGWLTTYKEQANNYIFIVFLINKVIGVMLLPAILVLAFSSPGLSFVAANTALILIALLLVLRFFRSYGLLKGQIKVSRFHFLLYIIGIEILPLALIYKALIIYLEKST